MSYEQGVVGRLGLAARAAFLGATGLALAVEGGAVVGFDIPGIVLEAQAGTGIPGLSITSKCPTPSQPNTLPGVRAVVTEQGKVLSLTFRDTTDGRTSSQLLTFGESGGFNAAVGHMVVTSYKEGSETDTQVVSCNTDTTVSPTTAPPTTAAPPTTSSPNTTAPTTATIPSGEHGTPVTTGSPTTTSSPNTTAPTTATIPSGEHGTPVSGGTTTTLGSGEGSPNPASGNDTTPENSAVTDSTAGQSSANKTQSGSSEGLARTGSDSETPLVVGGGLLGLGGLFIFFARRRRKQAEQAAA